MIVVRAATSEDAEAISTLLDGLDHPATPAEVRARLAHHAERDPTGHALVAERDGKVVGFLTTHLTPVIHREEDVGRITALVVSPEARGQGIGRALMARAEQLLLKAGAKRIELTSRADRKDAHRFYEGLGYRLEGVRLARTEFDHRELTDRTPRPDPPKL